MTKNYRVEGIDWDCDEEVRETLPESAVVTIDNDCEDEDDLIDSICDQLSNTYGWTVNSFEAFYESE